MEVGSKSVRLNTLFNVVDPLIINNEVYAGVSMVHTHYHKDMGSLIDTSTEESTHEESKNSVEVVQRENPQATRTPTPKRKGSPKAIES